MRASIGPGRKGSLNYCVGCPDALACGMFGCEDPDDARVEEDDTEAKPELRGTPMNDHLTDRQLDGLACWRCGREGTATAMVPIGWGPKGQLFVCDPSCDQNREPLSSDPRRTLDEH